MESLKGNWNSVHYLIKDSWLQRWNEASMKRVADERID